MSSQGDEKRRRRLTEDEHKLWSGVTRSVLPLKRRRPRPLPVLRAQGADATRVERPNLPERPRPEAPPTRAPPARKPPPGLAGLDRRQKQRLARGSEPIDRRIDLHGRSQSEAHTALLAFLRRAQVDGARLVLVITGKGGAGGATPAGARGILRRQVPHWLRLPEFRPYVVAADAAHPAHGGEGALYVRLRRAAR
jgi:DNA-nicking Smr family endonuclease